MNSGGSYQDRERISVSNRYYLALPPSRDGNRLPFPDTNIRPGPSIRGTSLDGISGPGGIDFDKLIYFIADKAAQSSGSVRQLFMQWNVSRDNVLSAPEIQYGMDRFNMSMSLSDAEQLRLALCRKSGATQLGLTEFIRALSSIDPNGAEAKFGGYDVVAYDSKDTIPLPETGRPNATTAQAPPIDPTIVIPWAREALLSRAHNSSLLWKKINQRQYKHINKQLLHEGLERLGIAVKDDMVAVIFNDIDVRHRGIIDFPDFSHWLTYE